jgi:bifunctional non-homologous end joining protein LigD
MTIYDRGTYVTEKWRDKEVVVVLRGSRVSGRYVLFHTAGKDWMIHRMDPPEPGWTPMPELVRPMTPAPATHLPRDDEQWAYELKWDGERAVGYVSGGRLDLRSDRDRDITAAFPELRAMAEELAPTECVLDGQIVAFDTDGRVSQEALKSRAGAADSTAARRLASRVPVHYLVFDVLWLDGRSTVDLPYEQRRELLTELGLAGTYWQTPPHFPGGGKYALETSRAQGLAGVVAKRLDSPYEPGKRSRNWLRIHNGRS